MEAEMRRLFLVNSPDRGAARKVFPAVWAARRESTIKTYSPSFFRIKEFLGRKKIKFEQLQEDQALEFMVEECEAGATPARLRQNSACVAMMAEMARTDNVLASKLAGKVKVGLNVKAMGRTKKISRRPASPEDVGSFLNWYDSPAATKTDQLVCVGFVLAFLAQRRIGDLAGLRWKDVTFREKDVVLRISDHKTVKSTGELSVTVFGGGKIGMLELLRRHKDRVWKDCRSPWVFPKLERGKYGSVPLPRRSWDRSLAILVEKLGLPAGLSWHSPRIGGTTTALVQGVPSHCVQEGGAWLTEAAFARYIKEDGGRRTSKQLAKLKDGKAGLWKK